MRKTSSILTAAMSCLGLCAFFPFNGTTAQPEVDISIDKEDSDSLVIKVRNRTIDFDEVVSSLVFTIRWSSSSAASLGSSLQYCDGAFAIGGTSVVTDGSYNYKTYHAEGFATIDDNCPSLAWTDDGEVVILKIKVVDVSGCTDFTISDDAFTTGANRSYFVALNGLDRTGTIAVPTVGIGSCSNDCDGTAGGTARPGVPCDDEDGGTAYSIWDAECECVEAECLEVVMYLDAHASETTWSIDSDPVRSGGPYTTSPGATIVKEILLPMDDCYSFVVNDSGSDGMWGDYGTGGYIVRTCGGDVIIDNRDDGDFGSSSSTACTNDICLPLGEYAITGAVDNAIETVLWRVPGYCSSTSSVPQQANASSAVTASYGHSPSTTYGFRYQLFDPDGLTSGHSGHDVCTCSGACTLTTLTGAYCRNLFYDVNGTTYAVNATGATNQKYTFFNASGLNTSRPPMDVWLNMRVQEVLDDVPGNYGPVVRIMFVPPGRSQMPGSVQEEGVVVEVLELSVWPNPASKGLVRVELTDPLAGSDDALLTIHDGTGKVVLDMRNVARVGTGSWDCDVSRLQPGLYSVTVLSAGRSFTEPLVIQ